MQDFLAALSDMETEWMELRHQMTISQEARDNFTQIHCSDCRTTRYDADAGSFLDIDLSKKRPFDATTASARHLAALLCRAIEPVAKTEPSCSRGRRVAGSIPPWSAGGLRLA